MLKMLSKPFELTCIALIAGACILSLSCARPPQAMMEEPPPPSEPTLDTTPRTATSSPSLPPPESAEINNPVERVFKGAVTIESGRNPYFIVGDFNGDLSQDIAVVVKPAPGKLTEINDELAAWILVDPIRLGMPVPNVFPRPEIEAEKVRRQRVQIDEGDVLLAVIHGFGANGWRDREATQTYVLKNGAGSKMRTQDHQQIIKADSKQRLPRLWGDVIAQTISGQSGFLYYNGAKYVWYDPRSYKPDPPGVMAHGSASKSMR